MNPLNNGITSETPANGPTFKLDSTNPASETDFKNPYPALEKFNLGAITSVELREIQLQKVNTENRYLTEELNAKIAELQLKYFSGKLITQ